MRGLLLAIVLTSTLFVGSNDVHAQRGVRAQQSAPPGPAFRLRSPAERLASVQRLDAQMRARQPRRAPVAPLQLANISFNDAFALTPRTPLIAGQGNLAVYSVLVYDSDMPEPGVVRFNADDTSRLSLYVNNPARRRLLIECTVFTGTNASQAFRGALGPGGIVLWEDHSTIYEGVISFLTPPMAAGTGPIDEFRIRHDGPLADWYLRGCQVTRLSLP